MKIHRRIMNLAMRLHPPRDPKHLPDFYETAIDTLQACVHLPQYSFYFRQWIDYKEVGQWRLKTCHDIMLFGGRIIESCRPNADSWYAYNGDVYKDKDVEFIRASLAQPWDDEGDWMEVPREIHGGAL